MKRSIWANVFVSTAATIVAVLGAGRAGAQNSGALLSPQALKEIA
jgi:hypothetical protein